MADGADDHRDIGIQHRGRVVHLELCREHGFRVDEHHLAGGGDHLSPRADGRRRRQRAGVQDLRRRRHRARQPYVHDAHPPDVNRGCGHLGGVLRVDAAGGGRAGRRRRDGPLRGGLRPHPHGGPAAVHAAAGAAAFLHDGRAAGAGHGHQHRLRPDEHSAGCAVRRRLRLGPDRRSRRHRRLVPRRRGHPDAVLRLPSQPDSPALREEQPRRLAGDPSVTV